MTPEDRARFGATTVRLNDGRAVVLRPLAASDGPALADFYATVPREDFRFYCPYELTREQAFADAARADSPLEVVLVIEAADGSISGYAWYRWKEPGASASGFGICLRRDHQGFGAGGAIMRRLLEIARTVGPPVMGLTVQKANARAVALYRATGFRVVREQARVERFGFPTEPEYCMERRAAIDL